MKAIKITVFGSSHCKYLSKVRPNSIYTIGGFRCLFEFEHYSGMSFNNFFSSWGHDQIDRIVADRPDYLITLFGGNSISTQISRSEILTDCKEFYRLVFDKYKHANPNGKLVASQILCRFNHVPNKFNTPGPVEYKLVRNLINRKICNLKKYRDYMMLVAGPKLDQRKYFNGGGTHLTSYGYKRLFSIMLSTV